MRAAAKPRNGNGLNSMFTPPTTAVSMPSSTAFEIATLFPGGQYEPEPLTGQERAWAAELKDKALDDPATTKRYIELGSTAPDKADRGPAGLQKLVDSEMARITPVLKAAMAEPAPEAKK